MPCMCEDSFDSTRTLRKEIDRLTQFLCYASGIIKEFQEKSSINIELDKRYLVWLNEHDERDFNRTLKFIKTEYKGINNKRNILSESEIKEIIRERFIEEAEEVHPLSNWHKTTYFDNIWNSNKFQTFIKGLGDYIEVNKQIEQLQNQIEHLKNHLKDLEE